MKWAQAHESSCAAPGSTPLRRAALDTSPPIDGVEEGRLAVPGRRTRTLESLRAVDEAQFMGEAAKAARAIDVCPRTLRSSVRAVLAKSPLFRKPPDRARR
ncbi:hypothetical protein FJ980_15880 [Mesorhizobium sp. B1-1-5]|nr:hypothetical protein FJ980_15880 [Mesorhizobium sp. B1-1-5]